MTAIVNTYNRTIRMADETVLKILALNKLWIPDVLIDIIKDYLYIDAYTVWRNFSKLCINRSIAGMQFQWYDHYDVLGRRRMTQWTKGYLEDLPQIQGCVCVTCGETTSYHTTENGCCGIDFDEEGTMVLIDVSDEAAWSEDENEDYASYQNQDEEYDW